MTHPYLEAQPKPEEIKKRVEGYSSWIEIDLDAMTHNLTEIRHRTKAEVMPCLKNNAYGHGLLPVAAHLADNGVKRFFVAKLKEALAIREHIGAGAVSMDTAWTEEQYRMVVEKGVTQVVYTVEAAEHLSKAATNVTKMAHFFVKVDTGLRRVGVSHIEAPDFIERVSALPDVRLDGIMSTLPQNPDQDRLALERLLAVEKEVRRRGIDPGARSLASSDSTFHNPAAHLDLIRPGAIVYGFYPEAKDINSGFHLRQALAWKARIEYTKWIEKDESVTYWGRYIAPERMRIGTLHVGFYDGIPRELANKARIRVEGDYRNSLGSVSLNHLLVDLRQSNAKINDVVEVISTSGENTLSKTAETAGWMVYSLLNHLSPTIPRVYVRGGEPTALLESC